MTDTTSSTPAADTGADRARESELSPVGRPLKATELDIRMLGMVGALQGFIIAYLEVSAIIVTLGGLLIWRGGRG